MKTASTSVATIHTYQSATN